METSKANPLMAQMRKPLSEYSLSAKSKPKPPHGTAKETVCPNREMLTQKQASETSVATAAFHHWAAWSSSSAAPAASAGTNTRKRSSLI